MSAMQHTQGEGRPASGLSERASRFMRDISEELASGSITFPTSMDASLRIRRMIDDPDIGLEVLAKAIVAEPLLSSKLVRLANSAAFRTGGPAVADVKTAALRVGVARIRTLAIAVAVDQMVQARQMAPVKLLARQLWEHSVNVAALAFVLTRKLTGLNPDTALYAGIVHDIGQFYLLSRVADYPELLDGSNDLSALMFDIHKSVGHAVLESLGTPDEIVKAVDDHDIYGSGFPPGSLGDVLFIANQMAEAPNPFVVTDEYSRQVMRDAAVFGWDRSMVDAVVEESRAEMESIAGALKD